MGHSPNDAALSKLRLRSDGVFGGIFDDLGTRDAECAAHGAYVSKGRRLANIKREIWSRCPACVADDEARVKAEEEAKRAAWVQAERERMVRQACLPSRFIGRSFDNFVAATPEQAHALAVCREYAETFYAVASKTGASLVLSGKPGTGKSHLSAAIIQAVIGADCWAQYVTCMDMVRMVRATWRRDSEQSELELLDELGRSVRLLVIDEIGMQYGTDGEQTILFDVLDRRYRECRPTILLTNQDRAGFKAAIGDRVYDRMTEVAKWVAFDWASYRPTARKAVS